MYVSPIDKLDHYSPPVVVTNPDSRFALFSAIWTGATVVVHDRELACVL